MKKIFSDNAWEDYLYWQRNDRKTLVKVNKLLKAIERDPYQGIGKPEPLRHGPSGYWSRRINAEHRLVYKVETDSIFIAQLRYHY
ncbi:MAG: Txe/YoeB family addiction module toxin [Puniceicoccaceae bacterium]